MNCARRPVDVFPLQLAKGPKPPTGWFGEDERQLHLRPPSACFFGLLLRAEPLHRGSRGGESLEARDGPSRFCSLARRIPASGLPSMSLTLLTRTAEAQFNNWCRMTRSDSAARSRTGIATYCSDDGEIISAGGRTHLARGRQRPCRAQRSGARVGGRGNNLCGRVISLTRTGSLHW